jgi:oligopeptide transport system ATP-binding protein
MNGKIKTLSDTLPDLRRIMEVQNLKMHFDVTKGLLKRKTGSIKALDGVSFSVERGKILGIVGESGSGKTTLGHCLLRNYTATAGDVFFKQKNMRDIPKAAMRNLRKDITMITQDPYTSLNPRMTVFDIVTEGMAIHKLAKTRAERYEAAEHMLETVGVNPGFAGRFPHEFSGGQRQRISIARALAIQPSFIVCDEVVSALDVSIQAQIIMLLLQLRDALDLTYVFIGHDLSVVRYISDSVAVMYLGKIVELTCSADLYSDPLHPYTRALISAAPLPDPDAEAARERIVLSGEALASAQSFAGCNFSGRCRYRIERCMEEEPPFEDVGGGHFVACHLYAGKEVRKH